MIKNTAQVFREFASLMKIRSLIIAGVLISTQISGWAQQLNLVDPCMATLYNEQTTSGPVTKKKKDYLSALDSLLLKYWNESGENLDEKIKKVQKELNSKKTADVVTYLVEPCDPGGGGTQCSVSFPIPTNEEFTRCGAGNVTLSAAPGSGGNTVYWYNSLTETIPFSSGSNVTVHVTESRAYYASSYNTTTGCESSKIAVFVSISGPAINASITASSATLCLGQSVRITSFEGVGTSHYWCSSNGGSTWNVFADSYVGYSNFDYTPTATGMYRFLVRNSTECGFCTSACTEYYVDVTVINPPVLNISQSTPGFGQGEVVLTVNLATGYNYRWFLNDVPITGATSVSCTAKSSGTYKAEASNSGCLLTSSPLAVTVPTSNNYNYVVTNVINKSGVTSLSQINALTADDVQQSIVYFDGQGRTIQEVVTQGSQSKLDIVAFSTFDNAGRNTRRYLPYTGGNNGSYKTTTTSSQASFYSSLKDDSRPFSDTKFENSPMGRVLEVMPDGAAWYTANKKQTITYSMNGANEVRQWNFNSNTKTASTTTYYVANQLYKTEYRDEENFLTIEYKDKSGKVVCKKSTGNGTDISITCYVYDDFGNLRFIVPPEAEANLTSVNNSITFNDSFCQRWLFAYDYDQQLRTVQQSVPGGGITYLVYDPLNRVVLAQDAIKRATNQWLFTKHDVFSRTIMNGIYRHATSLSQAEMQALVDSYYFQDVTRKPYESRSNNDFVGSHGYTNQSFPVIASPNNDNSQPFQVYYYDDYDFDNNGIAGELGKGEPVYVNFGGNFSVNYSNAIRGKASGSRILVLETQTWLTSAIYYDSEGRTIQTQSENYSIGTRNLDVTALQYDFSGKLLNSERRHHSLVTDNTFLLSVKERQVYDHGGRLLEKYVRVNDEPEERIATYSYNEIGEAANKVIGNSTGLQSVDYKYNIRGWLSNINGNVSETGPSDYFTEQVAYNTRFTTSTNGLFDGKIKEAKWKSDLSSKERLYDFNYDAQNRLNGATYKMNNGTGWISDTNLFTENNLTYDKNGNIKTLDRYSGTLTANKIDELSFNYGVGSNQLMKVSDNAPLDYKTQGFMDGDGASDDYAYDANGNLTKDLNKGIASITYNIFDLPDRITFTNESYIQYTYSADGEKLSQLYFNAINSSQKKFEYQGGFIYEDGVLQVIFHDEGRIVSASNTNLISNTATSQANSLEGFTASGSVALTREVVTGQNYVKVVCNQTSGTPGLFPIGGIINVKPGERYAFKVLGFQSTGTDAKLIVRNGVTNADIVWPGATLPVGQTNETWVTSTFTVPAGVTQIKLGIFWNTGASSKAYYVNEIKLYKLDYEFHYFLNDHLGSPRVVLQTNPSAYTFTSTMESENFQSESSQFFNLRATNEIVFSGANSTPGGNEALSMNANYHVGPSRSFKVMPGDVIDASVTAYYVSGTYSKTSLASMAMYVVTAMAGTTTLAVDGINSSYSNSTGANSSFLLSPNQGTAKPSAFLNYILFDDAFRPVEAKSAPLGATAGVVHPVVLPTINIKEAGYLFVYLSYDNDTGGDVFFDDLKIVYKESPLIQMNTYYPFGMTASSWVREGEFQNRYLYQGKEFDENTQLQDFHTRQYDGSIGRWLGVDSKGEIMPYNTPYASMMNNPASYIDPNGDCPICLAIIIGAIANTVVQGVSGNINSPGDYFKAIAIGGLAGAAGYGVGQLVAGQVGTIGFEGGFMVGSAGGFAGGFVSGAGNSWTNGASFGQGLSSGLKTGLYGGIAGGVIGGAASGINSATHGGDFWTGEGAEFLSTVNVTSDPGSSQKLEYSNEYAKRFSDKNFGKKIKGLTELHADNTVHPLSKAKMEGGYIVRGTTKGNAITTYLGTGKGSNVYLAEVAFRSPEQLYLTMGHEYLHVGFNSDFKGLSSGTREHAAIARWEYAQSKAWNFRTDWYSARLDFYSNVTVPYVLWANPNSVPVTYFRPWF